MIVENREISLENQMGRNGDRLDGHRIINWQELGLKRSAQTLIDVLAATYGRHNLSSSVDQTAAQIEQGILEPAFLWNGDHVAACAALIKSPTSVEIGRAANAPGERGGARVMLDLVNRWKNDPFENRPLVAEIRMAFEFQGIAGGSGSQATLLGKVGMIPHAFIPAFHHPGPNGSDRQEIFCFSSLQKKELTQEQEPVTLTLPMHPNMNLPLLGEIFNANRIASCVETVPFEEQTKLVKLPLPFVQVAESPFSVFTFDEAGKTVFKFKPVEVRSDKNRFTLVVVDTRTPQLARLSAALIVQGFVACGISAPHEGVPQLLFGHLQPCQMVGINCMRNFPFIREDNILEVTSIFYGQANAGSTTGSSSGRY
jgi:hypothetical protein